MAGRVGEDPPHEVEAVRAAGVRHEGLGGVFGRKGGHGLSIDIGRVRKDQVVALVSQRLEQIPRKQSDAIDDFMLLDVAPCDRDRARRQVHSVDRGIRKDAGGENSERTAAGA